MDLTDILRRPEGKTLEFKRDLSSPRGFLRTVAAFANTAGGTVVIGVADRTRDVRGVGSPMDLEERAVNLITDSIQPRILPDVDILSYRDSQLLAVHVHPSAARPHFIRKSGLRSGTYVRVGSTNRQADAQLIAEMQRFAIGETFDDGNDSITSPMRGSRPDDSPGRTRRPFSTTSDWTYPCRRRSTRRCRSSRSTRCAAP